MTVGKAIKKKHNKKKESRAREGKKANASYLIKINRNRIKV